MTAGRAADLDPAGAMLDERADRLHADALVVDALTLPRMVLEERYLERVRRGGFDCVFLTCAMPDSTGDDFEGACRRIGSFRAWAQPGLARICTTVADIRDAAAAGELAVVLLFQDPRPICDDLLALETFYALGLRVLQVAYNAGGYLGAGCAERVDGGLTFFCLEVLAACEQLGIMVDVSHAGDRTTGDTLKHAKGPVVCTHANARAVCANPRNKPDELLQAIAASGGVVGLNMYTPFVTAEREATIDHVFAQLDYLVGLLGDDHVGLGLDTNEMLLEEPASRAAMPLSQRWRTLRPDVFGAWGDFRPQPRGFASVADAPALTRLMLARGYPEATIRKILGENWLRVAAHVWGS